MGVSVYKHPENRHQRSPNPAKCRTCIARSRPQKNRRPPPTAKAGKRQGTKKPEVFTSGFAGEGTGGEQRPGQAIRGYFRAIRRRKHSIVFSIRQQIVIGPTPPGTGVMTDALGSMAAKSTSPHSLPVSGSRLTPRRSPRPRHAPYPPLRTSGGRSPRPGCRRGASPRPGYAYGCAPWSRWHWHPTAISRREARRYCCGRSPRPPCRRSPRPQPAAS